MFEENQVIPVKTYASTPFPFMEYVLHDINDAEVLMMRTSSKQVDDSLVSTRISHLIADNRQIPFVHAKKEFFSRSQGMPLTNPMFGTVTINSM